MNAKEYLKQIRTLDLQIDQRIMEKNDLEWIASRFPGTSEHCRKLAESVADVITDLVNQKDEIIGKILQLKDQRYANILYLHYVRFILLEDVAVIMQKKNGKTYHWQHISRLHAEAVNEYSKLM